MAKISLFHAGIDPYNQCPANLKKKNLDMIVANIANHDLGLGFESDYNEVTIVTGDNIRNFPEERKTDLAFKIVDFISEEYFKKSSFQRKNA